MKGRIRQLASDTAVYGISSIVGRLVNFLLFPLYSHVFLPDAYGPIIILYAAFVFLNIVYQHGMESAYLKFASDEGGGGRSTAFTTAMLSVGGVMLVCTALMLTLQGPFAALIGLEARHLHLLGWAAAILALDALAIVPFADLRLQNRPWTFAGVRLVNIAVNVGLNLWLLLGLEMGVEAILMANAAASAVTVLLLVPVMTNRMAWRTDGALWKRMLAFGLPFVPGGLGYALTERINIFFLERMDASRIIELYGDHFTDPGLAQRAAELGPGVYTEYVVGTYGGMIKLAVLMALFVQMFRYAWQPFFLQRQRDPDAPELFGKVFFLLTWMLGAVLLAVSFLADDIVSMPLPGDRYLIGPAYWMGLSIIPVALLGYFFQGWYYHFSAGAYIRERTRWFLHATLAGSVVAVAVNALFVPTYGMMAAAAGTAAAYATMALVLLWLVRPVYPVPYAWGRVGTLLALGVGLFAVWAHVPGADGLLPELGLIAVYAVAGGYVTSAQTIP
jgi:O-antigen/teichoic acid export membrane protein